MKKPLRKALSGLMAVAFLFTGTVSGLSLSVVAEDAPGTAKPVVYERQDCYAASDVVTMKVNGVDVPVIKFLNNYDHTQFSFPFPEKATIELTFKEDIETYSVSPLAKNIEATPNGKTLTFSITESTYMIVKVNGVKEIVVVADDVETDVPNATGDGIYNLVADYGADPTGNESVVEKLQKAIDDAAANGGITYVPSGLYKLDGNIELPSNTKLYMEGGAVIRCTPKPENFVCHAEKNIIYMQSFSYVKRHTTWVFRTALGADNVKIYGRGTFDGNGSALYTGTISNGEGWANTIFYIRQCTNFIMDGVTVKDSSYWTVETKLCENMEFTNLKVLCDFDNMTENDAIDVCESRHVLVKHMFAISEDDTYSTKTYTASGKIYASAHKADGTKVRDEAETDVYNTYELDDVTFDDCFGWTHCATFKVGDGSNFTQSNVTFKNSYSYKCMQALKISHAYGGADFVDILYENIDIESYGGRSATDRRWLLLDTFSGSQDNPGNVDGLTIRNINIRDLGSTKSTMKGRDNQDGKYAYVYNVTFENIKIPGQEEYAASLEEMHILDTNSAGASDYKILPVDNDHTDTALAKLTTAVRMADLKYPESVLRTYTASTARAFNEALTEAKNVLAAGNEAGAADAKTALTNATGALVVRTSVLPLVNLAKDQPVTVSGVQNETSQAYKAVDGSSTSCWRSQTSGAPYWIYVDLGESKDFDLVTIDWEDCFATNYKISFSDDGETWTDATVNGTVWQECYKKSKQSLFFDETCRGRYVRMYANNKSSGFGVGIFELEVYSMNAIATPAAPSVVGLNESPDKNLALEATAIDSGDETYQTGHTAVEINDADLSYGGYQPNAYRSGQWVGVEFTYTHTLREIDLYWETDAYISSYADGGYEIQVLQDGTWVTVTATESVREAVSIGECKVHDTLTLDNVSADGVKVVFLDGKITDHKYAPKLFEMEVYPSASTEQSKYVTATSVTLNPVDGCEYSCDGETWQKSNIFSGLTPNTTYTFYQRYAATEDTVASPMSKGLEVTTLAGDGLALGDVNKDGSVDASDLTVLARHSGAIEAITDVDALAVADVNKDGTVDASDLTHFARFIGGVIDTL